MGSIGVIMEFVNLEKLYEWARIQRYSIKTGAMKDAGADYKSMSPDERALFQKLIDQVLGQFKAAVVESRKIKDDVLDAYSDGRVFTGEEAVKLGFADQLGTWGDALKVVGELSGLGAEPKIFRPRKHRLGFIEFMEDASSGSSWKKQFEDMFNLKLRGHLLMVYPNAIGL